MKDYYYILGITTTATTEDIKKAYRKLSLKFHPDKNDGDEFFSQRFREIHEGYEILVDNLKRKNYDDQNNREAANRRSNSGSNFSPEIEYFNSNKLSFEYNEEVTFTWKVINADKVILKPFGAVQPIGQKTYIIKDFKNFNLTFELFAENTTISRQIRSKLTLANKTYKDLYLHFKEKIKLEEQHNANINDKSSQDTNNLNIRVKENDTFLIWFGVLFLLIIVLYIISRQ